MMKYLLSIAFVISVSGCGLTKPEVVDKRNVKKGGEGHGFPIPVPVAGLKCDSPEKNQHLINVGYFSSNKSSKDRAPASCCIAKDISQVSEECLRYIK